MGLSQMGSACAPVRRVTRARRAAARGFTVIELLVVVAIIALLVGILMPSLAGARAQAKRVLCGTNMRSQGQSAYLYAQQNGDTVLRGETAKLQFACILLPGLAWDGSIHDIYRRTGDQSRFFEACGKTKPLQCPTFPNPEQSLDYVVNAFPTPYTDLNIFRDVSGGGQAGSRSRQESVYDVTTWFKLTGFLSPLNPSRVVYIAEGHETIDTDNATLHDVFFTSQLPYGAYPRMANDKRHPAGANVLFFDGSVRLMTYSEVDAGWPNPLAIRLKWFTAVPE
ncbi:MAG: hypothetical protein CHACPFDD_01748 [Phycisphaerae bacterium]|nr:hypothetical protein [Phycisphaerae bacterium]